MSHPVPEEGDEPIAATQTPADEHESHLPDEADKPQGPLDPSGPGGLDAQPPPGGPQRSDSPSGRAGEPGTPAHQHENAGTSADQPSDASGGE
ncbi:MAG TPA: hypothetical protein VD814_10145 [Nocardioides sp.]|nr:hypothetical protein [Nocardioides sp.]